MAKFSCPQCGRGFGTVGEMLSHTQEVHAEAEPYSDLGSAPSQPARGMPSARPGPVATERASQTGFEVEPASSGGGSVRRGPAEPSEDEDDSQSPTLGTLIALIVIAAIILLNIFAGGE